MNEAQLEILKTCSLGKENLKNYTNIYISKRLN